jgi:hypothetical protein
MRLHYIRVPKTGSTALKPHVLACDEVQYNNHNAGCRVALSKCNSTHVHAKQPGAIVFGVIRSPCEHFDSVHRHLARREERLHHTRRDATSSVHVMPKGQETTPMQLAQSIIAFRRSSAAAGSPALAVQEFARSIIDRARDRHFYMLFPQAYYLPDAPWSRPVCYNSNTRVLAHEVNRVVAGAGVRCRILPRALDLANVNKAFSPKALPGNVCRLVTEELYPEDAALFDKHCSPKALLNESHN